MQDDFFKVSFGGDSKPWDGWEKDWETAADLVAQMTLEEKLSLVSNPMSSTPDAPKEAIGSAGCTVGIDRLGIPTWDESDASLGVNNPNHVRGRDDQATAFPSSMALGATFSTELATLQGDILGTESRAKGFTVQLAGGMNLVREPRGGRNFEYVSEDALLSGVLTGSSVRAIQSHGVISTLKHFALNPQETGRVMISSDISEKNLRESDLLAFQIALERGKPRSIMPGYNMVNKKYASENAFLLNEVLKGDWQFKGFVMADWAATHSTEHAAWAGLDRQSAYEMDTEEFFREPLRKAVEAGLVSMGRLDDMVTRILAALSSVGGLAERRRPTGFPAQQHLEMAKRIAEQSVVLLKNEQETLPIPATTERVVVVGGHADVGVLSGGGSTTVTPPGWVQDGGISIPQMEFPRAYHPPAPLDELRRSLPDVQIEFLHGGPEDVVDQIQSTDLAVVFAENWATEGRDLPDLLLEGNQNQLISAVAGVAQRTVVVLETSGPVRMPWLDTVDAVAAAWYGGSGGAGAIAAVLTGKANPSGRLPVTFPSSEKQLPRTQMIDPDATTSSPGVPRRGSYLSIDYDVEGADVGYRWFQRHGETPLFPFGYGLSYTTFEYSQITIDVDDDGYPFVEVTITNTGDMPGIDTPQVYIAPPQVPNTNSTYRLAGWARVQLEPEQHQRVRIVLDERRIYASYDPDNPGWTICDGDYSIRLARDAASRPILEAQIHLHGAHLRP